MELEQYQVSAFSQRRFGGNPAAVVALTAWLPDALMQSIAAENNLSETAFYCPSGDGFELRWFTPTVEVDLCGHATLAAAHVLYNEKGHAPTPIQFSTHSGVLTVRPEGEAITLDFPARQLTPATPDAGVVAALGAAPVAAYEAGTLLYEYADEAMVKALAPDMKALAQASEVPVIVTSAGETVDFVSRFFGPQVGIDEDPVTGSAHCALTPLWSQRLGKTVLEARQLSPRGGELVCELRADRVLLTGQAMTFLHGTLRL